MKLSIRNKLLAGFGLVCLVVSIAGIISFMQVKNLRITSERLLEENDPLIKAIMEFKYRISHAHLFLEEILAGDASEDITQVWQEFDQALWYCNAILNGGKKKDLTLIASKNPQVVAQTKATKETFLVFIARAKKRYAFYASNAKTIAEIDQGFEQRYRSVQLGMDALASQHPQLAPQLNHLKFQLADTQLFFEQALNGDSAIRLDLVKQRFSEIFRRLEATLETSGSEATNLLDGGKWLLSEIPVRIQVHQAFSGAGSEVDEDVDALFEKLLAGANATQLAIQEDIAQGLTRVNQTSANSRLFILVSSLLTLVISLAIGLFLAKDISQPVTYLTRKLKRAAKGELDEDVSLDRRDELGVMAQSFQEMIENQRVMTEFADRVSTGNYEMSIQPRSERDRLSYALSNMTASLREMSTVNQRQIWLEKGLASLVKKVRGELDLTRIAQIICEFLAEKMGAQIASFYLLEEEGCLKLQGDYAFHLRKGLADRIQLGQGLVGQAARSGKLISITEIPDDYIRINSSLGDAVPANIVVCPFLHEGEVKGVIELASHGEFSADHLQLLENCMESIASAVNSAQVHERINLLREEAQRSNAQLQVQQEELQAANEELEEKTQTLQESEAELQTQQEELQVINEELEEKNRYMADKQTEIERKNLELEDIKKHLELKAIELETSGKYKSEFLANMSHELRTPLNSLLILAQDLKRNRDGNLNAEQIESAEIIYKGGQDLLKLINEILDLSKIEAGQMVINLDKTPFTEIIGSMNTQFNLLAQEKGLEFATRLHPGLPASITTDAQRLGQILRNLCSNAIKFTRQGTVSVDIRPADKEYASMVAEDQGAVIFEVSDTGIGIPKDKQQEIFKAFQQVDGSTSRVYGGTGLGLSISRELTTLLGGVITLESVPNQGSTFRLLLPLSLDRRKRNRSHTDGPAADSRQPAGEPVKAIDEPQAADAAPSIDDDRDSISAADRVILVVEDDLAFAGILKKYCTERGLKFLHAGDGFSGLVLAEHYRPAGIILDLKLPGRSGWHVLESLKKNSKTRHIPVHIMSVDEALDTAISKGAIGFLQKPASQTGLDKAFKKIEAVLSKKVKDLLVVEDDENLRTSLIKLIGDDGVKVTGAATGAEVLEKLRSGNYDCMILDLSLPDMDGFEILEEMVSLDDNVKPPVIIYTGKELSHEQEWKLNKYASSIIVKTADSTERLLDETTLFLHKVTTDLPANKQQQVPPIDFQNEFAGRKILLVDDDMRNMFALSKVFQDRGFKVHQAVDGQKALHLLEQEEHIEIVLMDVMMPVMDGIEAIRQIRKMDSYNKVPIIALTAKAMLADRHKCIEAGASDYITKPVDIDNLLSLVRVWI